MRPAWCVHQEPIQHLIPREGGGAGAIQCAEGGGHYRPNRHAELSRVIFTSLERVIGDPKAASPGALLARLMHPK